MIKRFVIFSCLFVVIGSSLFAQNQKGKLSIGTSCHFHYNNYHSIGEINYQINQKIGYFFSENLNAGIDLNFHPWSNKELFHYESKALGPYTRYYFDFSKFKLFVESSLRYDFGDYYDGLSLVLGPGLSFSLSDFISIENTLVYLIDSRFGNHCWKP